MQVSLNWLGDYVDLQGLKAEDIAAALTAIGLEVEGVEKQTAFTGDVVVGKVLTAVRHPNADSLQLCTVDVGGEVPLNIVCGAPNARPGINVVVAKVGATLPGDFKIKKSKIRGETSEGMLCSEKELSISESHEGIIELKTEAKLGSDAAQALGIGDTILTLNVTPNRADCLGVIGVARDLAAKLKRQLKLPQVHELRRDSKLSSEKHLTINIHDSQGCHRFVGLYVDGVAAVPSPSWMQKRLNAAGVRPINLLVDATNYAMLEYSQPIHAYDARFVTGGRLEVRDAHDGETLVTLDGQKRDLKAGDLLICDAKGPIGLAGIMGGESSEIRADSTTLLIEVAAFAGHRIRRTSKRLGLRSEASHRFERGVDVDNLETVALRVAQLIAQGLTEAGKPAPRIAGDIVDCYPADINKKVIALRVSLAKQILGLQALSRSDVIDTLTALEFEMLDGTDDRLLFEVPYFRGDIEREVDLIEEVGRLLGFDRIPYQLPVMNIKPTPEDHFITFQESARTAMAALGLRETVSFPFAALRDLEALRLTPEHPYFPKLTLANPLSDQQRHLQTTLVPGLLRAVQENRRRSDFGSRLFECGRGYFLFGADKSGLDPAFKGLARPGRHYSPRAKSEAERPIERQWLAAVLDQPYLEKTWQNPAVSTSFYHGKATLLGLLRDFGLAEMAQWTAINPNHYPFLHPGAAATVTVAGKLAGYVGELHPAAAAALDLLGSDGAPVVLEVDLETLFDAQSKAQRSSVSVRRFPAVTRDVAFLLPKGKTHADVLAAIKGFKRRQHLTSTELFDVYTGDKLPAGTKSMAYRFAFQSPDRTLTDQEVEPELQALTAWLSQSLEAAQR
ncbi:MAG: phenylalanine--tRNA ligase subunit beta [Deltaproteobacteria bacterium]|nr:phenylalanine--tRNA ligase subunit beta [Deltaproteobacteria bacterium]